MNSNSYLVFHPLQTPRLQLRLGACLPALILFAWVLSIGAGFGYTSGQFLSGSNQDNNYSCVTVGPGNVFYGAWKANNPAPSYIKIATFNAGTWTQLTSITGTTVAAQLPGLDGISDWGPETMEIDASSNIHIAFGVGASAGGANSLRGLVYGKYTSATSSWAFRRLYIFQDSSGWKNVGNGEYALKLDASGNPHVVMKWSAAGPHLDYLKYAFFNGTVWNVTGNTNADDGVLIDSSPAGSREVSYPAIVFDSTGVLHCCYLKEQADLISGDCWYSKLVSGTWTAPANIAAVGNFYGGSMVVDSSNFVSIADISQTSYGAPSFNFRLITNASGSFQTSTVASYTVPGATYTYPSYSIMKINSAGRRVMGLPLTGYNASFDVVSAQYRLAYETSPGVWQQEVAFTDDTNHALSKGAMDLRSSDNTVMGLFAREQGTPDARNLHFATGVPTGYVGGGASAPTVTTAAQSGVTHNSATLGGNVTADGGASVTERGIVWGTATNPTTGNNKVQNGSGTGAFSATVGSLPSSTTIFVRAYAINSVNTSYGNEISFATSAAPTPEIVVEGNATNIVNGSTPPNSTDGTQFLDTVVGVTSNRLFTIRNTGSAPLSLSGAPRVAVSGAHASDFVVFSQPAATLAAGGSVNVQFNFTPSASGLRTATVTIANDDSDESPFTFDISGTGVVLLPEIAVSEAVAGNIPDNTGTFSFGSTTVGSPVTKTFTVTNSGSAALTLSNLTPPSGFAIAQNFGSTTVAASGGQTTFQIVMSAGAPASPSGTLTFDTNDSDENPFNFTISGTVIAAPDTTPPIISGTPANITGVEATSAAGAVVTFSSPTALDAVDGVRPVTCVPPSGSTFAFGTTTVVCSASDTSGNSASSSFTVTVLDTLPPVISGTPSNISGVAATSPAGAVVTYTNPTATDVVDGVVTVSCVPPSGSTFPVGVTTVVCSATDSHMNGTSSSFTVTVLPPAPEIAVSGNGNNIADGSNLAAASTTNATDFGSTPVQGGLVEVTYTITNSGPGVLNLSGGPNFVSVTPSTDFSVTQQPAATVADSGGTTTFKIAFNPTTAATTSATVTFGSDDADEGSFDFVIKGIGTPAQTFDLAGNAVANTPFDGGETYIYGSGPPPVSPLPLESPAVLGAQAPGLDPGIVFSYFGDISLNNDGDAVVYARVSGAGISAANDGSVWVLDENGFNLLIREGDAMPVGAGTVAEPLSSVRMTNTGVSHFMSGVAGTGVTTATNAAGWVDDGTSVTPFYLKGTTFSNVFNGVSQQTNTDDGYFAGQLKLVSGSVTAANDTGVWKTEADGTVTPAVREGAVIAGAVKVGNLMNRVAVGSNGMGVYPAYLTGVTPAATNRAVLKQDFYNGGAPVIVVQSQIAGSVPGVAGGLFSTFSSESVNASGKVAIGAMLVTGAAGGGVTSAEDTGIWREDASGNLELVIREGEQVTGRDPGVVYAIFSEHWLLDDGGMVVQATLRGSGVTGSNNSGLWHIDAAGTKTLLVGTGETVAELGGAQVSAFNLRPDVSAAGKYAVTVKLTTGVAGTVLGTNLVLLVGDVTTPGTFSLKLRSGDAYSVGGTARQIRNMFLGHVSGNHSTTTGGTGGMSRAVNDAGQVAVWLEFTDGTKGMFVGP